MNKNKYIVAVPVLVIAGVVVGVFGQKITPKEPVKIAEGTLTISTSSVSSVSTSSVPVFPHDVKYLADGTVDTSDWQEFRSEYGGFSVRAPKNDSSIGGCMGKGCTPEDESVFQYTLAYGGEGVSVNGMNIFSVKKKEGVTFDTWVNAYILSGKEYISSVQKTTVQKYPALQFNLHTPNISSYIEMDTLSYSSGQYVYMGSSPAMVYRYTVVDVGNRYVVIVYTVSIDIDLLAQESDSAPSPNSPLLPRSFDNKALSDIYKAIFNSLVIFTPTKK